MDDSQGQNLPRIAYLIKCFPRTSETFILHEILELEHQGLPLLFAAADLVVSMGGIQHRLRAIGIGPAEPAGSPFPPRQEQLVRATLLAERGLVHMLHPEHLTPQRLIDLVQHSLLQPRPRAEQLVEAGIVFHGQPIATQAMLKEVSTLYDQPRRRLTQAAV